MTAQVIFLNTFYYPDEEEQFRLDELQDMMEIYQAEIEYNARDFNEFQKWIYREKSHHNLRRKLKLIKAKAPFPRASDS